MGAGFACQVWKFPQAAGTAIGPWTFDGDFRAVVAPDVKREQGPAQFIARAGEELQCFTRLDGTNQIDRGIQDSGSIAGVYQALRWCRKNAGEAGGLVR